MLNGNLERVFIEKQACTLQQKQSRLYLREPLLADFCKGAIKSAFAFY